MADEEILQIFKEETDELLEDAENALLTLEDDFNDENEINKLFRAFHTLKGSSGLFGFDGIVSFTHNAENLLDKVRNHEVVLDSALLGLFLKCRDHIRVLIDAFLNQNGQVTESDQTNGACLTEKLEVYLAGSDSLSLSNESDTSSEVVREEDGEGPVESENWHISLRFKADALRNGMDPMSVISYLQSIGPVVDLFTLTQFIPTDKDFDPESCYLGFEVVLDQHALRDQIDEAFEFLEDECDITILAPRCDLSEFRSWLESRQSDDGLKEILCNLGSLSNDEIQKLGVPAVTIDQNSDQVPSSSGQTESLVTVAKQEKAEPKPSVNNKDEKPKAESSKATQQFVRVHAGKLEELINLVGELVISGANTRLMAQRVGDSALIESVERMVNYVDDIRDTGLALRMVEIGDTFNRFRRVVRDYSQQENKKIELEINGGDSELDKTVVEKIGDPLTHLVRNALDHGLEAPEDRIAAGKPEVGKVTLNAYHDSGNIVIEVADDGKGLSKEKLVNKAIERGLITPEDRLSDQEIYQLIFNPGLSTAESVSNISGRGVGMDVVKKNIDALRGHIEILSETGVGSTIRIRLPLTLAIIDGFQIKVGESSFVLPLDMVDECVELNQFESEQESENDTNYINLRGEVLPYIRLNDLLDCGHLDNARENVVVVEFAGQRAGLVVDELMGEHQTVIKPLGKVFEQLSVISGATILGDGKVAMIIDVPKLIHCATDVSRSHMQVH